VTGGAPVLGILQLENRPLTLPGSLGHPGTFAYPTRGWMVPGARVDTVVGGAAALAEAYVEGARALDRDGAKAITTNCGFTVLYQARLSAAVRIPVATSSLLLLPFMAAALAPGRAIGLVTLRRHAPHVPAPGGGGRAGRRGPDRDGGHRGQPVLGGAGRPGARHHRRCAGDRRPVRRARCWAPTRTSHASWLECAAFCPVAPRVRAETGRPVLDFVTLADLVMAAAHYWHNSRSPR
jgi:hypothetical protein